MAPDDLNATLDLLAKAAEEYAKLPVDSVPASLRVRMISAQVRLESLRMSLASIQIVLQGRGAAPRVATIDDDAAGSTYH